MRVKYFSISLARVFEEVNCQLKVVHSLDEIRSTGSTACSKELSNVTWQLV